MDQKFKLWGDENFSSSRHQDLDDRFGRRPGQPSGYKSVRVPFQNLDLVFKSGGASARIDQVLYRELHNVGVVYLSGIHVTGLATPLANGNNLRVSFETDNHHYLTLESRNNAGCTGEGTMNR